MIRNLMPNYDQEYLRGKIIKKNCLRTTKTERAQSGRNWAMGPTSSD